MGFLYAFTALKCIYRDVVDNRKLAVLIFGLLTFVWAIPNLVFYWMPLPALFGNFFALTLVSFGCPIMASGFLAIHWHRAVLPLESDGQLMPIQARYISLAVLVSLVFLIFAIVLAMPLSIVGLTFSSAISFENGQAIVPASSYIGLLFVGFLWLVFYIGFFMFNAPSFVSIAIGASDSIVDAMGEFGLAKGQGLSLAVWGALSAIAISFVPTGWLGNAPMLQNLFAGLSQGGIAFLWIVFATEAYRSREQYWNSAEPASS